ncbi:MAG: AraC family transcriptional regulator ligand-binding domain-containing protein [Pseudomonadota bacterium]
MNTWVRSGSLVGARELIGELGGNAELLAAQAGIDPAAFSALDFPVPISAALSYFDTAATACRCDNFGLRLAQRQDFSVLGPLWPLFQSAATVGDMLRDLADYYLLHASGGLISAEREEHGVTIYYSFATGSGPTDRHGIELGYGVLVREFRKIQAGWLPRRTQFCHAPPLNLKLHREFFGRGLMFNADRNGIFIDDNLLATPLQSEDSGTHRTLTMQFRLQREILPGVFRLQTESALRSLIPFGPCDLAVVARAMRLSGRSLQRHLAHDGTNFNQLLDAVRADLAIHYLRQSDLAISDIAEILGYAESSVLTRAFRRWYGVSPRAARNGAL